MNFNEMNLPTEIVGNLTRMGILIPTEIQKQSTNKIQKRSNYSKRVLK